MPKRSRSVSPASPRSSSYFHHHEDFPPRGRSASPVSKFSRTSSTAPRSMFCTLPPHAEPVQLDADAFDTHYIKEHTNRCTACLANLPSAWMLELHIGEMHDPLVAALREKGEKTYKCFVETCERACSSPVKRRLHLIDKHQYPRDYDFGIVHMGVAPGRTSMLRRGRAKSSEAPAEATRKRGGLGKMTGTRARRRSSVMAQESPIAVPAPSQEDMAVDPVVKPKHTEDSIDSLSSTMGAMRVDMTPRSLLIKRNKK